MARIGRRCYVCRSTAGRYHDSTATHIAAVRRASGDTAGPIPTKGEDFAYAMRAARNPDSDVTPEQDGLAAARMAGLYGTVIVENEPDAPDATWGAEYSDDAAPEYAPDRPCPYHVGRRTCTGLAGHVGPHEWPEGRLERPVTARKSRGRAKTAAQCDYWRYGPVGVAPRRCVAALGHTASMARDDHEWPEVPSKPSRKTSATPRRSARPVVRDSGHPVGPCPRCGRSDFATAKGRQWHLDNNPACSQWRKPERHSYVEGYA